jgi:hypothetical protein
MSGASPSCPVLKLLGIQTARYSNCSVSKLLGTETAG